MLNLIQRIIGRAKMDYFLSIYQNGDNPISYINPELLDENGKVKCDNGLILYDEEEDIIIANTPQEVYNWLFNTMVLDECNASEEELNMICSWLSREYNVNFN